LPGPGVYASFGGETSFDQPTSTDPQPTPPKDDPESFYCGDAAGRPAGEDGTPPDFSDSDKWVIWWFCDLARFGWLFMRLCAI
jgi:hypothetical protein